MTRLNQKANELRLDILDIVMAGKCGHIGGDMSAIDVLCAIYEKMNITPETVSSPDRDRFVLSKGHCVEALYAVLADRGFLKLSDILETYSKFGSEYIGHPHNKLPGIEMCSGSLGHGLSACVGMALAGKMDGRNYRVYTLMGDGELAEGSVWEAAMAAGHYCLDNLCALVDRNGLQISGSTETIMAQNSVSDRFHAFGWNTIEVTDGNNAELILAALDSAELQKDAPTLIIANTVKGSGSPLMENKADWHHRVPTTEEYTQIRSDIIQRGERKA